MKLGVNDRAMLLTILPREGNFDTLKLLRKFKESLSLSEAELQKIHWRVEYKCMQCGHSLFLPEPAKCGDCNVWLEPTGQAQWNTKEDPYKDVFVSPLMLTTIVSILSKLNEKNKLTEELFPLYEKFVGDNLGE